jgi:transcriptional regulator of acetoin/glycerol metabolism
VLQASNLALSDLHSTGKEDTSDSGDDSMPSLASTSTEILSLEEIEKQALIHALEVTDNNITKAAQALGINRVTIHRKLKRYNLLDRKS